MKKTLAILLILCTAFALCSCEVKTRNRSIAPDKEYFGTYSQISTYADCNDEKIESYVKIAEEVLSYYHELFDIYNEYDGLNNIKTINDNAGEGPVIVNADMLDFLEYCKEVYTITGGKTNVMLGSVLKIWHDCREMADENYGYLAPENLPDEQQLRLAAEHTSIDSLVIDRASSTVYISDPEASLDVGAIAKGYVVDIVYERLKAVGADATVINIGGNVRPIGQKRGGEPWISAIRDPDGTAEEPFACRIKIGEVSIVTSGDYERYFVSGTEEYHHIVDPETLMPARYFSAVSVCCTDSALGDALSTALFCMSYEDGLTLVESLKAKGEAVDVLWIDTEGNQKMTDGFRSIIYNG